MLTRRARSSFRADSYVCFVFAVRPTSMLSIGVIYGFIAPTVCISLALIGFVGSWILAR